MCVRVRICVCAYVRPSVRHLPVLPCRLVSRFSSVVWTGLLFNSRSEDSSKLAVGHKELFSPLQLCGRRPESAKNRAVQCRRYTTNISDLWKKVGRSGQVKPFGYFNSLDHSIGRDTEADIICPSVLNAAKPGRAGGRALLY